MTTSGATDPTPPVLSHDPRGSITYWVISTAHALERVLNELLAPLDITFRQAEVLVYLAMEGTMSQSEMARRMGIVAPTLAGIVARMERSGWIIREACPHDRRKKLLRPTPRAEPVWSQILEQAALVRARAGRGVPPEELARLIQGLAVIQANLDDARGPNGQPQGCAEALSQQRPHVPDVK